MRSFLFVLLVFFGHPAAAADWQRYAQDQRGGNEFFVDLDSLRQDADGFEITVRLLRSASHQEFRGKQAINCRKKTFRLSDLREIVGELPVGDAVPDEHGEIGKNTAQEELLEFFCVSWQEPAGARWEAFANTPGDTHYVDLRGEPKTRRQKAANEHRLHVKVLGSKRSILMEVRLFCAEKHFALLNGVHRDEERAWLSRLQPRAPQPMLANSAMDILRTWVCKDSGSAPGR